MKGSQKKRKEKRSFPFMGERNSRRRKEKILFSDTSPPTRNSNVVHTLWGTLLLSKKIRSFAASVHGFPKNWRGFFPLLENAGEARFVLSFLFTAFSHASEEEEEEKGGKRREAIYFLRYGGASDGFEEEGGVWRRFYLFFRYIRLGFFRSGKPGHGLGSIFLRMAGGPFVAFVGFGVKNGGPNGKAEKRGCFITDSPFPLSLHRGSQKKKQKAKE